MLCRFDDDLLDVGQATPAFDAGKDAADTVCSDCFSEFLDAQCLELGDGLAGKVGATDKRHRHDEASPGFFEAFVIQMS
jgi:hypothetical protein